MHPIHSSNQCDVTFASPFSHLKAKGDKHKVPQPFPPPCAPSEECTSFGLAGRAWEMWLRSHLMAACRLLDASITCHFPFPCRHICTSPTHVLVSGLLREPKLRKETLLNQVLLIPVLYSLPKSFFPCPLSLSDVQPSSSGSCATLSSCLRHLLLLNHPLHTWSTFFF